MIGDGGRPDHASREAHDRRTYELRAPATDAEWAAYHDIRRRVLFELRGRGAEYEPNHPDESRIGHHPLVLFHDGVPLGGIRIDVDGDIAIFRRVAVREDVQRHGHGRHLLSRAEAFARSQGCRRIDSHVDAGAVGFYERCGFRQVAASVARASTVLMTKSITTPP